MTLELGKLVLGAPKVPVENVVVAAARTQETVIPGYRTNPSCMALHRSHELVFHRVPDLQVPFIGSNCKKAPISGPLHRSDVIRANVVEFCDLAVQSRPEVDAGAKADCQDIFGGPIDEVQVEIILETGSVKHLVGLLGDHSLLLIFI